MDDIWIEVSESPREIDGRFFRCWAKAMPGYGAGIAQMAVQFNLTAYVKHMIEQAKSA